MLPTPETPDLPSTVYPPSEDSYLLLDTLSSPSEASFVASRFPAGTSSSPTVVEIGTGSGVVIAFLTVNADVIFGRTDITTLAVDLNPDACRTAARTVGLACRSKADESGIDDIPSSTTNNNSMSNISASARQRGSRYGTYLDALEGDLCSALRPGSIDVLVFNPPYVPTDEVPTRPSNDDDDDDGREEKVEENATGPISVTTATSSTGTINNNNNNKKKRSNGSSFERESRLLDLAVAGGVDGMEVTARLLDQLDGALSGRGVAYVLLSVRNHPARVAKTLAARGWRVDTVGGTGKKGGIEKLVVLRVARPVDDSGSGLTELGEQQIQQQHR